NALGDAAVVGKGLGRRGDTCRAELRLAGRQNRRVLRTDGGGETRVVDGADARDRDVVDFGIEALDRDVQITFQRERHRLVERQAYRRRRLAPGGRASLRRARIAAPCAFGRLLDQLANPRLRDLLRAGGRRDADERQKGRRGRECREGSSPCHLPVSPFAGPQGPAYFFL